MFIKQKEEEKNRQSRRRSKRRKRKVDTTQIKFLNWKKTTRRPSFFQIDALLSLLGLCNGTVELSSVFTCCRASRFTVLCSTSSGVHSQFLCVCVSAIGIIDFVEGKKKRGNSRNTRSPWRNLLLKMRSSACDCAARTSQKLVTRSGSTSRHISASTAVNKNTQSARQCHTNSQRCSMRQARSFSFLTKINGLLAES